MCLLKMSQVSATAACQSGICKGKGKLPFWWVSLKEDYFINYRLLFHYFTVSNMSLHVSLHFRLMTTMENTFFLILFGWFGGCEFKILEGEKVWKRSYGWGCNDPGLLILRFMVFLSNMPSHIIKVNTMILCFSKMLTTNFIIEIRATI